jgi:hypothetical protein
VGAGMEVENLSPPYCWPDERGECGPVAARGRTPSGDYREGQSTGRHRDGTARSSWEGSVMGLEPRGRASQIDRRPTPPVGEEPTERSKPKVKSFDISKRLVFESWEKVRDNRGAPGVDAVSITDFAAKEKNNLYKLWSASSRARREAVKLGS